MTFEIGQSVGPYRITGILGQGGMGSVYRVEHTITRRVEALKVAVRGRPAVAGEDERFLREIQVQASLTHPNIASVHNAFWAGGNLMFVMELVEGEPLSAIVVRGRPPLDRAIDWILQVLDALSYAHARGIIHRDVAPKNMMITRAGVLKLTDFGVARSVRDPKLTESGAFIGSAYYAAPEQIRGSMDADERTDLYSAGVVLYELLTGVRPYEGSSAFDVMQAHIAEDGPKPAIERNPEIGAELNAVAMRALEKNPAARFQSAADLRAAIASARTGVHYREPLFSRLRSVAGKRTLRLAAGVVIAIGVMAGAATWFGRRPQTVQSPPPAASTPEKPSPVADAPSVMPPAEPVAASEQQAAADQPAPEEAPRVPATPGPKPRARVKRRTQETPLQAEATSPAKPEIPTASHAVQLPPVAPVNSAAASEPMSASPEMPAAEPATPPPASAVQHPEQPKQRHPVIRALRKVLPFGRKKQAEPPQQ